MAVSLSLILTASGLAYYLIQPTIIGGGTWNPGKESKVYTSHDPLWIEGDANFTATAALEGWLGNGTPENPFIIDGLEIARIWGTIGDEGNCIFINNTRVSFTITNCNLTGAGCHMMGTVFAGITLQNVSSGLIINNIFQGNEVGILLQDSHSNTVVNNSYTNNMCGIHLDESSSNNMTNNTCNDSSYGISLWESDSNTLANNTCNNNYYAGIIFHEPGMLSHSGESHLNTVVNNSCNNNEVGISIKGSNSNTIMNNTCSNNNEAGIYLRNVTNSEVVINTCNKNDIGISLEGSDSNTLTNNTCKSNDIGILIEKTMAHYETELEGVSYQYWKGSDSNTLANNTCNNNDVGIAIHESRYNTIVLNSCNYNRIGIFLGSGCRDSNIVVYNTCLGNTENDIADEDMFSEPEDLELPVESMFMGLITFVVITLFVGLMVGKRVSKEE